MCFCITRIFCVCILVGLLECGCCSSAYKHNHEAEKFNSVNVTDELIFLKRIFLKYGNNGSMNFDGFQELLSNIGLVYPFSLEKLNHPHDHHRDNEKVDHDENLSKPLPHESHDHDSDHDTHHKELVNFLNNLAMEEFNDTTLSKLNSKNKCLSATEAIYNQKLLEHKLPLTSDDFLQICPAIIFDLDRRNCVSQKDDESHLHPIEYEQAGAEVWLFAIGAVVIISLCGLCSVAMVPLIQRVFYQSVLQFLVGLAIGSLSGDSLLHLLPHAMAGLNHHDHQGASSHGDGHGDHSETESHMWRGLVALTGIYTFYLAERLLTRFSNCYRKAPNERKDSIPRGSVRKLEKVPRKSPVTHKLDPEQSRTVGEKLSHHKQGSYGFNFDQLEMEDMQKLNESGKDSENIKSEYRSASDSEVLADKDAEANDEMPTKAFSTSLIGKSGKLDDSDANETLVMKRNGKDHSPMMIAVHGNVAGGSASSLHFHHSHHHHHHHHHSHLAPPGNGTISSVAWMVIMGDGLHNFCDGLAIGAAFAAGISSGISTTIAVFCHELPHELGDFAMLIKAGMSVKQALIYNGLSSILCFVGMMVGVLLGNVGSATLWVFAGAAGMFLYIALVDMLPELNTQDSENGISHLLLQALGIISGISIMLVIAIYEHDLRHLLS